MAMTSEKIQRKYQRFIDNLHPRKFHGELDILRHFAGNFIEAAQQNFSKIAAMDIPQSHKDIAYEILLEELAIIHEEFNRAYQEL